MSGTFCYFFLVAYYSCIMLFNGVVYVSREVHWDGEGKENSAIFSLNIYTCLVDLLAVKLCCNEKPVRFSWVCWMTHIKGY